MWKVFVWNRREMSSSEYKTISDALHYLCEVCVEQEVTSENFYTNGTITREDGLIIWVAECGRLSRQHNLF